MTWEDEGLCRGATAQWFPEDEEKQVEVAAICDGCKSKNPCRTAAISRGERIGVWGGLTEKELNELADEREKLQLPAATDGNCACQCIKWHAPIPASFEEWDIIGQGKILVCPATADAVRQVLDGSADVATVSKYAQVLVRLWREGVIEAPRWKENA